MRGTICRLAAVTAAFSFWTAPAWASPIIDGVFDRTGEWAGHFVAEDTGQENHLGPGDGGQLYDAEYLGLVIEGGSVYFGLQTGHQVATNTVLPAGDFAFDIGSDGTWDYAIDFLITGGTVNYSLIDMRGTSLVDYSDTVATHAWRDVRYSSNAISSPFEAIYTTGDVLATFSGAYSDSAVDAYGQQSYVLEGMFDLSLFDILPGQSVTMHWTMACGNDYLETDPTQPVSEPVTMLLFGSGLMALASLRRKREKAHRSRY